jgi:hypothetical protein
VKDTEYGGNIVDSCMKMKKMRPIETVPETG